MIYGKVAGIKKPVPKIILGTAWLGTADLSRAFRVFDCAFDAGVTAFDTAHAYGDGQSEQAIGKWMSERGNREQMVIISKCAHPDQTRKRLTERDIWSDIHESLSRLGTGHLDICLLHRDDLDVDPGTIVEIMNVHVQAGRVKSIGVSNWTCERIEQANQYARKHGLIPFTVSSPNYTLAEQLREPWQGGLSISGPSNAKAREWYVKNPMPVFAWSSLASGFYSGKFTRENIGTFTDGMEKLAAETYGSEENFRRLDRAKILAAEKNTGANQIVLAFLMNQTMDVYPVVATGSPDHFRANLEAIDLKLTEREMEWLDLHTEDR